MDVLELVEKAKKEAKKSKLVRHNFSDPIPEFMPSLYLAGVPLIGTGEVFCLNALPGTGKSMVMESLAAAFIAANTGREIDTLGFSMPDGRGKKVLWVDTERTKYDIGKSRQRLGWRSKMSGIEINDHVVLVSTWDCETSKDAFDEIENELMTGDYSMVLIDGFLDIAGSLNDETTAQAAVKRLNKLLVRLDISAVVTMHPNKGTETMAGHVGAFLYRLVRACTIIKKDGDIRTITNDFLQGKLSHAGGFVDCRFQWDNEKGYMDTTEAVPTKTAKNASTNEKAFSALIGKLESSGPIQQTAAHQTIMDATDCGLSTAKNILSELVKQDFLRKSPGVGNSNLISLPEQVKLSLTDTF